jgi:basic amino acid/polyamine antiporter, APA family
MQTAQPRPVLSVVDAIALIVGVVVGAGIFKTPALVAANSGGVTEVVLVWAAGGLISLIGALCYAELVTAYPHPGGEYHYLRRAYGGNASFLFAWTRLMVMQTGSIALLAFVFADYASALLPIGEYSSAWYAAGAIVVFTVLNMIGLHSSSRTQKLLCALTLLGLLAIVIAGLLLAPANGVPPPPREATSSAMLGMAMIFVLLTYGGWNEAAYISAEVRDGARNMVRALLWSIAIITVFYVLLNIAFLRVLGLEGLAGSSVPAHTLAATVIGPLGATLVSLLIALVALASLNVTIFTGARTNYALAKDYRLFGFLGHWNARTGTPLSALLVQGLIALALVVLGASTRQGFETMVEYVSPVFWLFFLLTGLSLFVLRRQDPQRPRPFRVPLYPFTPIIFSLSCAYLLYSSLSYTGIGALFGVAVLVAGVPLLVLARRMQPEILNPGSATSKE